jgi:hypothetical protein
MTTTPQKPSATPNQRPGPTRSPSQMAARITMMSGAA